MILLHPIWSLCYHMLEWVCLRLGFMQNQPIIILQFLYHIHKVRLINSTFTWPPMHDKKLISMLLHEFQYVQENHHLNHLLSSYHKFFSVSILAVVHSPLPPPSQPASQMTYVLLASHWSFRISCLMYHVTLDCYLASSSFKLSWSCIYGDKWCAGQTGPPKSIAFPVIHGNGYGLPTAAPPKELSNHLTPSDYSFPEGIFLLSRKILDLKIWVANSKSGLFEVDRAFVAIYFV